MANPLLSGLNPQNGGNSPINIITRFQQFKNSFTGDPRQKVQELLNSGQMSQEQLNNLQAMASQLQSVLK